MWSTLLSKFIFNKYIAILLVLALAAGYIAYQRYQISVLTSNVEEYKKSIVNLESQISAKNDEIDLTNKNVSLSNSRLTQCYTQLRETLKAQKEIDTIMMETEPTEEESSKSLVEKDVINPTEAKLVVTEVPYTPVTKYQMKRGLEFVNKQMGRITNERSTD